MVKTNSAVDSELRKPRATASERAEGTVTHACESSEYIEAPQGLWETTAKWDKFLTDQDRVHPASRFHLP